MSVSAMKAHARPASPPIKDPVAATFTHDNFPGLTSADRAPREEIQHRAYAIWQSEGSPPERHVAHWLQAELEVMHGPHTPANGV